jgi:hypothetical protein
MFKYFDPLDYIANNLFLLHFAKETKTFWFLTCCKTFIEFIWVLQPNKAEYRLGGKY